ncbi:hypothetical protein BH11BAC4_BH11BAC4_25490 [soil metagenome]
MKLLKKTFILIISVASVFILFACNLFSKKERFVDSELYDFSKPTVIKLPEALDEISGIAYYPKDTSVFAIVDEDGLLYKIPIKNPQAAKAWRFDKQRDYEDVVLVDSTFYILVSNGDIETVHFAGDSIYKEKSNFSDNSKKTNEFESLYYNRDSGNLVMVCKSCDEDSKKTYSSFSYNFNSKSYENYIVFDAMPVAQKLGLDKVHMKASAAAINPVTEDLYVLSSLNHCIAVLSKRGLFKQLYKLDPGIYKQPEGITFTPQGDLIISNEQAETGFAELLVMKNKRKGR